MSPRLKSIRLGRVVSTPGAIEAFRLAHENYFLYLARHANGDWGDVCSEDAAANDEALRSGERLVSAYHLSDGTKIWFITEADRASTCILLPQEY